ncbi:MAG TPA: sulfurtransferase TusA family protein [Thermoplasmata archaeon]|nr:sulfurtransferase TusA family protein [Thermoplasmata archaeon]
MPIPDDATEVRSITGDCTGLITELEKTLRKLPPGAKVWAVVKDIPTRIDILAWAGRKGHRVTAEPLEGSSSRLLIEKGSPPTTTPADPSPV